MKLESLDFLYMPSRDPAAEMEHLHQVLGWPVVFAIEAFGTRVAMLKPTDAPPAVLLAGHLDGERPVLVYRVESLERTTGELREAGAEVGPEFGIPHGPVREIDLPGGHRMAIYELTRPEAAAHLQGRRDF